MSAATALSPTPGSTKQEPDTVESLIRRAHANLEATDRSASPSRVTRAIRRYVRDYGFDVAATLIDDLALVELPTTAEAFAYDMAVMNNQKVGTAIPAGFAAMPAISRMNLGDRA